jgi:hypothetical protein
MRRKWRLWALAGAGLFIACVVWQSAYSGAQDNGNEGKAKAAESPLPIRQVVLFNSGVGYFQREGEVSGDARVDLTFPAGDINDLLKSLVLQDLGGGRISTVNYDSQDPLDKILHSFALDLNNNPSFGQILNQARGEKIEILRQERTDAQPTKVTGIIVGMEVQRKAVGKDGFVDEEFLNLSGPSGLQAIPMDQVLGVKFLNPVLENEFHRALKVLASSHDTQKKLVSLGFNGPGKRAVRVGYVVERPIWKTTYRLRLEPNGKLSLQGWALVENTSDDDWSDVRMVLVSGKPISYQMNLYEPLYIPRPFVEPELFASLRPPIYSGSLDPSGGPQVAAPGGPPTGQMGAGPPPVPTGGFGAGGVGQRGVDANAFNRALQSGIYPQLGQLGQFGGQFGQFGGQLGQFGGQFGQLGVNMFGMNNAMGNSANLKYQNQNNDMANFKDNNRLTYEELQLRRQRQEQVKGDARKAGAAVAGLNFKEGIQSVATAEEIGDYFRYVLDQKITLARQKSAMLPILDQNIEGTKVSIYNETTHAKYPLLGLKLKNTSGQPLTQGPITVYENSTYAGDTRILNLQPNEERLLSYALDQGTEVKSSVKAIPSPEMNFKIGDAKLTARYKLRETKEYTIKNRSTHDRTLIVEHPIRGDWKLIDPKKPTEKTRDHYRFTVQVPAGKAVAFDVTEEQSRLDTIALVAGNPPFYGVGLGIEVKQVLKRHEEKLVSLKIQKGIATPTLQTRESKVYYVQNLSDQDRDFTVDHIIRPDWARLGENGDKQAGPGVYRFTLHVAKGKTGNQEIDEETIATAKGTSLKDLSEIKIREYINNSATSAAVRAGLTKLLELASKVADTGKQLGSQEKQLDALSKDQARLRENLKIIPTTSEHYKKFLEKFVSQEARIETLQNQVQELQAALQNHERVYEGFVTTLNAE